MEVQLKRVLSAMEGVGEVEVMITFETEENSLFGTSAGNGRVCGVVVVAEGAGNAVVETRISNAIKALFSIEAHKISIVKRAK
jgi:stage III sporulation protein AG